MYPEKYDIFFLQGFKEEIDGLQEELDVVQNQGAELMTACGEPDKPVIKKSIDEVTDYHKKKQLYKKLFICLTVVYCTDSTC